MKQILDARLGPWPKVMQGRGGQILIEARVLTPLRFFIADQYVLTPGKKLWGIAMALCVMDAALTWLQVWTMFWFIPFQRDEVYMVLGAAYLLYKIEIAGRYRMIKLLFAKTLRFRIKYGRLYIGKWPRRLKFSLGHDITFGVRRLEGSHHEIFQHSSSIDLILAQTQSYPFFEVVDHDTAARIVRNLNAALHLAGADASSHDFDLDPTRA